MTSGGGRGACRIKVAHLVSHPIQYFAPLYRELASRSEIDLTVYFYSDESARGHYDAGFSRTIAWEDDLLAGYDWRVCRSARNASIDHGRSKLHLDIVREVASGGYDVVWAHGYSHAATWIAAAAARLSGAAIVVRDEQTLIHGRPLAKRVVKRLVLGAAARQVTGLYVGEHNRRYLAHYGLPQERLHAARYCVDNRSFQSAAETLRPQREQLRRQLGVSGEEPVVLFVGKLIDRKRPLVLVEAFRRIRPDHPAKLLIVGDGELSREIETHVANAEIPDVVLGGFHSQAELPKAYAVADVFALLSGVNETWGLVVNEAMNFGLPLLLSDAVGSADDLVEEGANGFVVPRDDVEAAAARLRLLVADASTRASFGARSLSIVNRYSIERCADGVVAGCIAAAGGRTRHVGGRGIAVGEAA